MLQTPVHARALGPRFEAAGIKVNIILRRTQINDAAVAINDNGVANGGMALHLRTQHLPALPDNRNTQRPRNNRHMVGITAFFKHDAFQLVAVVIKQRRRTQRPRHQDDVIRHGAWCAGAAMLYQVAEQTVAQVFHVLQSFTDITVVDLHHARAGLFQYMLHRRLGAEALVNSVLDAHEPAAVAREHLVGFENIACFGNRRRRAVVQHAVDRLVHAVDRPPQALYLRSGVIGNSFRSRQARLV